MGLPQCSGDTTNPAKPRRSATTQRPGEWSGLRLPQAQTYVGNADVNANIGPAGTANRRSSNRALRSTPSPSPASPPSRRESVTPQSPIVNVQNNRPAPPRHVGVPNGIELQNARHVALRAIERLHRYADSVQALGKFISRVCIKRFASHVFVEPLFAPPTLLISDLSDGEQGL